MGWNGFDLSPPDTAAVGGVAALSRIPNSMELWWIAPNGAVKGAFWYEGGNWTPYEVAPPGSARPGGAIAAVSRIPTSMELWWAAPNGSVQAAFWYEGQNWNRYELAPAGSIGTGGIAALARVPNSMEVWWVAPDGSVQDAFWYEGQNWNRFALAPAGSARPDSAVAALSRIPTGMEVWWVGPDGSVQDAFWYEGQNWNRFALAPAGSAAGRAIAAVSRIKTGMELWWVAPNGSVQDAFWYEGGAWQRFELAPPGSADPAGSIAAVSRIPTGMEVWWVGPGGSVQDAFWYEGGSWQRFELAPGGTAASGSGIAVRSRVPASMELWWITPHGGVTDRFFYETPAKVFSGHITSGGLAALGGWMEVTVNPDGSLRWRGHAHDSGADGYDFGVSAIVRTPSGRALGFQHKGHVGGTFTAGSRDHDWDEPSPPVPLVAANFADFADGTAAFHTEYSSDIGSALEGALGFLAKFIVGATPAGAALGVVVFVGVEVGSLISTGSLVPGARVVEGVLWLAGPSNMLLALAADGIASAGSRTREIRQDEYDWANNEVFRGGLPPRDRLVLTDTIGPGPNGGRAFTFPRFDGKITLNMGPTAFDDPRAYSGQSGKQYGRTFIHELVHACQIHHTAADVSLLADALASKVCEGGGGDPYAYGPAGPDYRSFNLEQQAQIVSDWFVGENSKPGSNQTGTPKDEASPYFPYIAGHVRVGQF